MPLVCPRCTSRIKQKYIIERKHIVKRSPTTRDVVMYSDVIITDV